MPSKVFIVTAYDAHGAVITECSSVASTPERAIDYAGPTLAVRAPGASKISAIPALATTIPGSSPAAQDMRRRL